jgi:hypothetical protein
MGGEEDGRDEVWRGLERLGGAWRSLEELRGGGVEQSGAWVAGPRERRDDVDDRTDPLGRVPLVTGDRRGGPFVFLDFCVCVSVFFLCFCPDTAVHLAPPGAHDAT